MQTERSSRQMFLRVTCLLPPFLFRNRRGEPSAPAGSERFDALRYQRIKKAKKMMVVNNNNSKSRRKTGEASDILDV